MDQNKQTTKHHYQRQLLLSDIFHVWLMTFKRISSGTHKRSGTVRCYISDLEAKNPILLMKSADDTWLGRTEKNTREDQKTAGMCLNCCQTAHSSEALHCADPGAAASPPILGWVPAEPPLHCTTPQTLLLCETGGRQMGGTGCKKSLPSTGQGWAPPPLLDDKLTKIILQK